MKENGTIIKSRVTAAIYGLTRISILDNGKTIAWMDMEFIYGKMEKDMKVGFISIKSLAMENIIGQTGRNMRDNGLMESNMV